MELLKTCGIDTVVTKKSTPIVFHSEQSVNEVLEELSLNKITSAPVLDLKTNKALGFVDMLDLVHFALNLTVGTPKRGEVTNLTTKFGNEKIAKIFASSYRNEFKPIPMNATLYDAANVFKQGLHRIPVMSDKNEVLCIISQSDVICFLFDNKDTLGSIFNIKLKDLGEQVIHRVVTTSKDTPTIEAYSLLFSQGVNSLAVVDEQGALVGNLSPTDLKGLYGRAFENLFDPVEVFLRTSRIRQKQNSDFVAYVDANATLMDVLCIAVNQHVHRVWIVDDNMKPIGIVSLTDIIWKVLNAK